MKNLIYRTLRKLEGYVKVDLVYLTKGGFWLTTGTGLTSILALLSSILFAHFVSKEIFGTYQYVLTVAGILGIATIPEIADAMMRSVSSGNEAEFKKSLKAKMTFGIIGSVAGIGLATYYYIQGNTELSLAFIIVSIFTPFTEPLTLFTEYLKAKTLFKESTRYKIYIRTSSFLIIALMLLKWPNLFAIVIAYFAGRTAINLIFQKIALRKFPPNTSEEPGTTRFGIELTAMSFLKTIVGHLDKILIFHYLGAAEVALYYFAIAPVSQIRSLLGSIKELAFPKYSIRNAEEIKANLLPKLWRLEIFVIIPIIALYYIFAPYFFPILFPQYTNAINISTLYAISLVFFPRVLLNAILVAKKMGKALWISQTLSPIFHLIILVPSVIYFGLPGVIVGTIVINGVDFVLNLIAVYWPSSKESNQVL